MNILKLRKEMFPAIISGNKTSTSRQGVRLINPNEKLKIVMTEDERFGIDMVVTNVHYCKFNELTKEEAIKEGYSSLQELQDVLKKIYDIEKDDDFTIIEFAFPWDVDNY